MLKSEKREKRKEKRNFKIHGRNFRELVENSIRRKLKRIQVLK